MLVPDVFSLLLYVPGTRVQESNHHFSLLRVIPIVQWDIYGNTCNDSISKAAKGRADIVSTEVTEQIKANTNKRRAECTYLVHRVLCEDSHLNLPKIHWIMHWRKKSLALAAYPNFPEVCETSHKELNDAYRLRVITLTACHQLSRTIYRRMHSFAARDTAEHLGIYAETQRHTANSAKISMALQESHVLLVFEIYMCLLSSSASLSCRFLRSLC